MDEKEITSLVCAAPPEHEGKNLTSLSNRSLRCLDLYNARPEKDAMILVGILIGILLAIPVCLTIFIFWRRGFFFWGGSGPASFSRAFYKRTKNDEEFWSFLLFLPLSHFDESGRGLRISNDVRVHRKGVGVLIEKRKGESEYHRDRLDRWRKFHQRI